jgi:hypothetical protein
VTTPFKDAGGGGGSALSPFCAGLPKAFSYGNRNLKKTTVYITKMRITNF